MSLIDVRLNKIQIKEEGQVEGPYVAEFFIRNEPGQENRQIIGLPTQGVQEGEIISFEDKSLKTKWVQVTEVSDEYIIGAKVRKMKDGDSNEERLLEDAISVGSDLVGQTFDDLIPFQDYILADLVNLGIDAIQELGLFSYLEKPFGEGHAVLEERKLKGEKVVQRVRFDLLTGRKVEGDAKIATAGGRDGPWTVVGGGPEHGKERVFDAGENLDQGEKNGFVELLIHEKEGQGF